MFLERLQGVSHLILGQMFFKAVLSCSLPTYFFNYLFKKFLNFCRFAFFFLPLRSHYVTQAGLELALSALLNSCKC